VRQDVTVLNLSLANTPLVLKQLQRRPLRDVRPGQGAVDLPGRDWPKPADPLFHMTAAEMDGLQLAYPLDTIKIVNLGKIQVLLDPA